MLKSLIKICTAVTLGLMLMLFWLSSRWIEEPRFPQVKEVIVNESVVNIGNYCSGVIVKKNIVITAAHCIKKGDKTAPVIFFNHDEADFDILYSGKGGTRKDFAILQGDTLDLKPIPLTKEIPGILELVKHFGYSGTKSQWRTPGVSLLAFYLPYIGMSWLAVMQVIPGDSGGAIVNWKEDKVYGICFASYWPIKVSLAFYAPGYLVLEKMEELKL